MINYLRHAMPDTIVLNDDMLIQLASHFSVLCEWNIRTNLTAIVDPKKAALLHYRDCLEIGKFLTTKAGAEIADMGSGGGFPGIVLAVVYPQLQFSLFEPRRKRVSFLRHVKAHLGLTNVTILQQRSDDNPTPDYTQVISRATFSTLPPWLACRQWLYKDNSISASSQSKIHSLILMRSEGDLLGAPANHRYHVGETTRYLEFW